MVPSLLTFKRFCDSSIASLYDPADPANPAAFKTAQGETKEARRRLALEGEVREGLKAGMGTRQAVPAELIGEWTAGLEGGIIAHPVLQPSTCIG